MTLAQLSAAGLCAATGLAAVARAQPTATATHSIHFTSSVLQPGESTTVRVLVTLSPGLGSMVMGLSGPGPLLGHWYGEFDISGAGGSWSQIANVPPYNFKYTTPGTPVGGNVSGVFWSQSIIPTPTGLNPEHVWSGVFTAGAEPGSFDIDVNPVYTGVVVGTTPFWSEGRAQHVGGGVQIQVVPAPSGVALLALCIWVLPRRR